MNTSRVRSAGFNALMLTAISVPSIAFAAPRNFPDLVNQLINLLDVATLALFGAAMLFFFWSTLRNLSGVMQGNEQAKQELQKTLGWGVLIIFVMVSIWGIIQLLQQTLTRGLI